MYYFVLDGLILQTKHSLRFRYVIIFVLIAHVVRCDPRSILGHTLSGHTIIRRENKTMNWEIKLLLRASLGTLISYGIFIFSKKNELIFFRKMKISWEISVPKLALKGRKEKKKMLRGWSSWLWNDVAGRVWRPREERMDQIAPPCRSVGQPARTAPKKIHHLHTPRRRLFSCFPFSSSG
jgi:hypothetical protein